MRTLIQWLLPLAAASALAAQVQIVQTRVYTDPPGVDFWVDGEKYRSTASFLWPVGSKHTVWADPSYSIGQSTRYGFQGWADEKGLLTGAGTAVTVTASPGFTSLKGTFLVEHKLDLIFYSATGGITPGGTAGQATCNGTLSPVPGAIAPAGPGLVWVSGQCFAHSSSLWYSENTLVSLNAQPVSGFVFEGWTINGSTNQAFLREYIVRGPVTISPRFTPAKRVSFSTQPPGMKITVNRTVIPTAMPETDIPAGGSKPWELDFADGSSHVLGAPSPQLDPANGQTYVFDSFSIGGGEGTVYRATLPNVPQAIVARFVRGTHVSILTNPPGLKVSVNGRENWPSYNFVWGVGTKHTVTAPAETTDSRGRRYRFLGWAHGGAATQEIVTPAETPEGGMRWVANYELYPRITISNSQPGVRLTVDGAACGLPCILDRPEGTTVTLAVPESLPTGTDSRIRFEGWNDIPGATRTVTFGPGDRQLAFRYRTEHRLMAVVDPPEAATIGFSPMTPDGFYASGTSVEVTLVPNEGYRFRRWEGELDGTSLSAPVTMQFPKLLRALFDKVPHIPSAGIRNAAGETPVAAVAPGSVVSIFGSGLASAYVPGPGAPLAQTLGNVTVRINNRLLPILFVSPEQVNALVPSDLADGEHTLAVRNGTQPEIAGKFRVVRMAPGLFGFTAGDQFVATAQRPDGSLAAPEKPARRGEQITLLGTGFGATQLPVIDGFATPDNPPNPHVTRPEILVGDMAIRPDFAGLAPGLTGVTALRFTIPEDWPAGSVEIRIRQGEVESNRAILPIE